MAPPPAATRGPALVNGLDCRAALTKDAAVVKLLLPVASRRTYHKLLITACMHGHTETVQVLLAALDEVREGPPSARPRPEPRAA
jgi:hypothetical protein